MVVCVRGAERRPKRLREEYEWLSMAVSFKAYGRPLETVMKFKYLGRILTI